MSGKNPLNDSLPAVAIEQPLSEWIHPESVTGPFGTTAAVDHFDDVVDWQEHRRALTQGYYRLVHPPRVQRFKARLEAKYPEFIAVLYTSGTLALKEASELKQIGGFEQDVLSHIFLPETLATGRIHILHITQSRLTAGVILVEDPDLAAELHERNRRRGGSLSARAVAHMLEETDAEPFDPAAESACHDLLCEMEQAKHALFYPSGMGAVTAVLDLALTPDTPRIVVMGNVYRDTHLLLEEQTWAGRTLETIFLDTHDLDGLRQHISDPKVAGVFLETITNPLIEIPDMLSIATICKANGKPLLVDSTMASPYNVTPLQLGADVVIHSTSKYLSGHNSHGGGVVLTTSSDWHKRLRDDQTTYDNQLSTAEFTSLHEGLLTFPDRMPRFNANGQALAALLRSHPAVQTVYYGNQGCPEWLNGLGSVVSCELKNASLSKLETFYNQPLHGLIKAPSLGSNQTLFCPYVLLAYYDKSEDYLRDCNLSKYLLRFATGCEENVDTVLSSVSHALDALI